MSRAGHLNTCEVCGKQFNSKRYGALTCSVKCRTAKSRGLRSGNARGWYAVRPEYQDAIQRLSHKVPKETIDCIATILYSNGAIAAEWAIVALDKALGGTL